MAAERRELRGALDESRVSLSQLTVVMDLSYSDGTTAAFGCSLPSQSSGVGECATTLPLSSFATTRTATIQISAQYSSGTAFVASADAITLQAAVAQSSLSAAGVVATMPESPRFPGDQFSVALYAHTGQANFALRGWSLFLQYDANTLSLVTQQFSSVYQAPTYTAAAGTFDVVATGIASGQSDTAVSGQKSLYLMTLTFQVVSGATVGTVSSAFSGSVGAFVNQGTQTYLSNQVMSVTDSRGGLQNDGSLTVESVQSVGVFAYSPTGSLTNTAVFDGQTVCCQRKRLTHREA